MKYEAELWKLNFSENGRKIPIANLSLHSCKHYEIDMLFYKLQNMFLQKIVTSINDACTEAHKI